MKILPEDLDRALEEAPKALRGERDDNRRYSCLCLLAQAATREYKKEVISCARVIKFIDNETLYLSSQADRLMRMFDGLDRCDSVRYAAQLEQLRAQLPCEV